MCLPVFRLNIFCHVYKLPDFIVCVAGINPLARCWLVHQADSWSMFNFWTYWPRRKPAATIWANIM